MIIEASRVIAALLTGAERVATNTQRLMPQFLFRLLAEAWCHKITRRYGLWVLPTTMKSTDRSNNQDI